MSPWAVSTRSSWSDNGRQQLQISILPWAPRLGWGDWTIYRMSGQGPMPARPASAASHSLTQGGRIAGISTHLHFTCQAPQAAPVGSPRCPSRFAYSALPSRQGWYRSRRPFLCICWSQVTGGARPKQNRLASTLRRRTAPGSAEQVTLGALIVRPAAPAWSGGTFPPARSYRQ